MNKYSYFIIVWFDNPHFNYSDLQLKLILLFWSAPGEVMTATVHLVYISI